MTITILILLLITLLAIRQCLRSKQPATDVRYAAPIPQKTRRWTEPTDLIPVLFGEFQTARAARAFHHTPARFRVGWGATPNPAKVYVLEAQGKNAIRRTGT